MILSIMFPSRRYLGIMFIYQIVLDITTNRTLNPEHKIRSLPSSWQSQEMSFSRHQDSYKPVEIDLRMAKRKFGSGRHR